MEDKKIEDKIAEDERMEEKRMAGQVKENVEQFRELILEVERHIWRNPETGYREWKTSAYLEEVFARLGYHLVRAGNIPGFYADLDTGRPGPKIAVFGEMDSLICGNHPEADPETGYVHACGHNAQCAMLVGVAAALKRPGALDGLCGSFRLIAVPAEELIELGFREELREQGTIRYYGGKTEFIYRGYLDGVDMAMMIHAAALPEGVKLGVEKGCNGCVTKNITYRGVAAHAGGAPEDGVNALYAAMNGINAVNSIRETFRDVDHVRFHPIVTEAGVAVNAIPERAKIESYVRGAEFEAIVRYNKSVNRALAAGAASVGAGVTLSDRPGYFPLNNDPLLAKLSVEAAQMLVGEKAAVVDGSWGTGCTDMGDVSAIMPVVQPYITGAVGTGHGMDYQIADPETTCVLGAECLLLTAVLLLSDGAARAKEVLEKAKPVYASREEFIAAIDRCCMDKDAVAYQEDGTVLLDYIN